MQMSALFILTINVIDYLKRGFTNLSDWFYNKHIVLNVDKYHFSENCQINLSITLDNKISVNENIRVIFKTNAKLNAF